MNFLSEKPAGLENAAMYFVHDNGGRPFLVYIRHLSDSNLAIVSVWTHHTPNHYFWYFEADQLEQQGRLWSLYTHHVGTWDALSTFVGLPDGNTILCQISDEKYLWIGNRGIQTFEPDEPITNYYSPIAGTDVPYPVAISQNKYWFMLDNVWMSKEGFICTKDDESDLYEDFYGLGGGVMQNPKEQGPFTNVNVIFARP